MDRCPRNLIVCEEPCHLGLLHIESGGSSGCPWGINDAVSNYCFFNYMTTDHHHTDKEIARLLGLSATSVKQSFNQAVEKLSRDDGTKHLYVLLGDMLRSTISPEDDAIYDSEIEHDKHLYSRHKGECTDHVVLHKGTGKPLLYGLSKNWHKHIDKKMFKQQKRK